MEYKEKNPSNIKEGVWDERTCVRRIGGYNIDKTNLPASMKYLPKGAVLAIDSAKEKVVLVKTAIVYEDVAANATAIKVSKDNALVVGDVLNKNTITAIDTTNSEYDVLSVAAVSAKITKGSVLADANASNAIGLNYATTKLDDAPSCTPTIQVYEIEEDSLPYALTDTIKEALTHRHAFRI